ncbi:MAG: hypothetical protein IKK01_07345 [Clostridia bacterium]|nr:hypothetical protein [Clostridia bacterium]
MDNKEFSEEYSIDLLRLLKVLWSKAWIIAICGLLAAAIGFSFAAFAIEPTYSSTVKLYVNNNSLSLGGASLSLSTGDISASRSLVVTYGEILDNRTTLEEVIEKTECPYTYKELSKMLKYGSLNNTEVMFVTVTTTDPYEASEIANCISEVLPVRISGIIKGATMIVVDSAVPVLEKVEPSITKYTAIGFMLGFVLCCAVIVVFDILDDTIHDEEHVLTTYEYPILARIPDLLNRGSQKYGYYYKKNIDED